MARGCAVFTQKPPPADRSPGGGVVTLSAVIEFTDIVFRRLDDTVDADLEVQVRAAGITGTAAEPMTWPCLTYCPTVTVTLDIWA